MGKGKGRVKKDIKVTTKLTKEETKARRNAREATRQADRRAAELAVKRAAAITAVVSETDDLPGPLIIPAGDTSFYITYVNTGQGDCILIRTPLGKKVMIDCGSTAWDTFDLKAIDPKDYVDRRTHTDGHSENEVRSWVQGPSFLPPGRRLDLLVLTHGDGDHYNLLETVVDNSSPISVAYHSYPASDYGTAAGQINRAEHSYRVTVNGDDDAVPQPGNVIENKGDLRTGTRFEARPTTAPALAADLVPSLIDEANALKVGTTSTTVTDNIRILHEPNCTIDIIASEVIKAYFDDESDEFGKNRGSIVLLITAHGKRLLLGGDATRNTEQFLLRTRQAKIKDVDVVTATHHGSKRTSSMRDYVVVVNPTEVRINAPRRRWQFKLPNRSIVERYIEQMHTSGRGVTVKTGTTTYKHGIWCWDDVNFTPARADSPPLETELVVYSTGSKGTSYTRIPPVGGGG